MYDVIIIGAGASGLMAAAAAASKGARVALLEHKDDIGKKILATGNGRCNFTNTDMSVNKFHGSKALIKNGLSQFNYNYVDLLKRENIENEKAKDYIRVLDEKSQRLKQLTEDLKMSDSWKS